VIRPNLRFMLAHPAHLIAFGFGSGLGRLAPGTVGTLWAWLAFLLMEIWLTETGLGLVIALSALVGWWACTVTAEHMGVADSGHIVWDEVVAFWLVLWLVLPAGIGMQVAAFALFRFFAPADFLILLLFYCQGSHQKLRQQL
jgi:phosphatidylglycerophosphatase A